MPLQYPKPSDPEMKGITPQEDEPLHGPSESGVSGKPGGFAGGTNKAFDGTDAFQANAKHPDTTPNGSDFPKDETFSKGTTDALNTGGLNGL